MNNSRKYTQKSAAFAGNLPFGGTNAPSAYKGRQTQYMGKRTQEFTARRAYLASDFVNANVQGLTEDFYAYTNMNIRMAELATMNKTSLSTKKIDDYKEILLPDSSIDYLPLGAKIEALGSTWIVTNPQNIVSVNATAVAARCNASYSFYDEYGNVCTEPIVVERYSMESTKNIDPLNMVLMSGYFTVVCQKNKNTKALSENSRIILGKKAYAITGYADFMQEFSGDTDSCHYCTFTIRVEEPTERDDLVNKIADGLPYPFSLQADVPKNISTENPTPLRCYLQKDGKTVAPTEEAPQSFVWESDNPDAVAVVLQNGSYYAIGRAAEPKKAVLTAKLAENPNLFVSVEVFSASDTDEVAFVGRAAQEIRQYDSESYTAALFSGGQETAQAVTFTFSGADKDAYDTVQEGNTVTVTCLKSSDTPLVIHAAAGNLSSQICVMLYGY